MSGKKTKVREPGSYAGWMVPVWATRGASIAINVVVLMQITYYCTNALGLSPGAVGTILLLSKLFDGVTDLVAGIIVDKTHTKLGKARPFELCIIGVWIGTVLLFSTPNVGTVGKMIWVFALYTIINSIFATFLNATDAVYLSRAVTSAEGQMKVLSLSAPIGMVFCTIVSIVLPILIAMFGSQPGGWTKISLIFAVPFGIIGLGRFFFLKEVRQEEQQMAEKVSIKLIFDNLKTNKYVFIIALVTLLSQLISNIGSAVSTYYFQYIYGDIAMASVIGMIGIITPFFLMLLPLIMKKWNLTQITLIGAVCGVIGNVIKFVGGANMTTLMIGNFIAGLAIMPVSMMINMFLIECMDYGEWKNGTRVEAVFSSISGFANKLGSGFASIAVGFVMEFAGYDGTLAVQSQKANMSIIALYSVIPMVLFAIQFFVMRKYNLADKIPQIRRELNERRMKNVN